MALNFRNFEKRHLAYVPVLPNLKMPRPNAHHVVEGEIEYEPAFADHLRQHRLNVLGHHLSILRVHRDARVVERFTRVTQHEVKFDHAAFEDRAEKPRD